MDICNQPLLVTHIPPPHTKRGYGSAHLVRHRARKLPRPQVNAGRPRRARRGQERLWIRLRKLHARAVVIRHRPYLDVIDRPRREFPRQLQPSSFLCPHHRPTRLLVSRPNNRAKPTLGSRDFGSLRPRLLGSRREDLLRVGCSGGSGDGFCACRTLSRLSLGLGLDCRDRGGHIGSQNLLEGSRIEGYYQLLPYMDRGGHIGSQNLSGLVTHVSVTMIAREEVIDRLNYHIRTCMINNCRIRPGRR